MDFSKSFNQKFYLNKTMRIRFLLKFIEAEKRLPKILFWLKAFKRESNNEIKAFAKTNLGKIIAQIKLINWPFMEDQA